MRPGGAAVCPGSVTHRRTEPAAHEFRRPVSYVWLDPDDPDALCAAHPLWSASRPAPARYRRADYGAATAGSLSDAARDDLAHILGWRPEGEVRMLTQIRRWGWLFNPITVYVVWHIDPDAPVGVVLEVTNTPWKERHRYPVPLSTPDERGWRSATTVKKLHVSPFLDEGFRYDVRLRDVGERLELRIDVVRPGADVPTICTALQVTRRSATRSTLAATLRSQPFPTHRVSVGIHLEAFRLWLKRVPFVAHPSRRTRDQARPEHRTMTTGTSTGTSTGTTTDVHPEHLLAHATASRPVSLAERCGARVAARVLHGLLGRIGTDRLEVVERPAGRPETVRRFGPGGELSASVVVVDERAYSAVLTEGSVGFGRGYIEGWWTSDDPVTVMRVIVRNLGALDRLRNRWESLTGWATDRIRTARARDTRERNRDDIAAHYDIGNAFFELFLDETMTYSSAVFPTPDTSLADASRHKYDLLLDKLGVRPGDRLLEIGTGWGGMAIRAARRGCQVTTTTISQEQLHEARDRVAAAGMADRVTVIDRDWRDLDGEFDHVVSIEMIEAVDWLDYDEFFSTIERCLAPGGRAAIQAILLPDDRWERAKNTEDFIRRFVFPNGFLPSLGSIDAAVSGSTALQTTSVDDLGEHYAETLRRWRERFDARLDDIAALGLDERFQRLWRCYLAYCEAGFLERHVLLAQITFQDQRSADCVTPSGRVPARRRTGAARFAAVTTMQTPTTTSTPPISSARPSTSSRISHPKKTPNSGIR